MGRSLAIKVSTDWSRASNEPRNADGVSRETPKNPYRFWKEENMQVPSLTDSSLRERSGQHPNTGSVARKVMLTSYRRSRCGLIKRYALLDWVIPDNNTPFR
ncbi:hypothetical protein B7494_g1849 [Chlorociboria aeruginascens]|nr:hypothetical protein B7494_g1849 [Chlorociboria aeruginascens]